MGGVSYGVSWVVMVGLVSSRMCKMGCVGDIGQVNWVAGVD